MKNNLLVLLIIAFALSGCVSNKPIKTVQVGDNNKSCEQLQTELTDLGVQFEDAKDESGFTGKNVGLAILFWPGIFVNESRASRNQESVEARISYLSNIYNEKCSPQEDSESTQ